MYWIGEGITEVTQAMSASNMKVEPRDVHRAGIEMGAAHNIINDALGLVHRASQPVTAATFGEPHLGAVFQDFWTGLRQQVQLSADVFGALGKRMGGAAVHLNHRDNKSANGMNGVGVTLPPVPTPTPGLAPPGSQNVPPQPLPTATPPAETPPPSEPGNGTVNNTGSATGV
jgi:hypothetical protein